MPKTYRRATDEQLALITPPATAPRTDDEHAGTKKKNTEATYKAAWEAFVAFCALRQTKALPARVSDVIAFFEAGFGEGLSYSTMRVRRAAISYHHRKKKKGDPTRDELANERWITLVGAHEREHRPSFGLLAKGVEKVVAAIENDLRTGDLDDMVLRLQAVRDRALILAIYEGALSAYEAATLDWDEIAESAEGLQAVVFCAEDARPRAVTIARGPAQRDAVGALVALRKQFGVKTGPVFRDVDQWGTIGEQPLARETVSRIVGVRCANAGVPKKYFSPRALRIGRAMQGVLDGEDLADAMKRLGLRKMSAERLADELAPAFDARAKGTRRLEALRAGKPGAAAKLNARRR